MGNIRVDKYNRDAVLKNGDTSALFITVFTDASWCPDTKAYGCAYWVKIGAAVHGTEYAWGGYNCKSAEDAELEALEKSVEVVLQSKAFVDKVIVLQSDCLNALNRLRLPPSFKLARHVKKKHVKAHTNHQTKRTSINAKMDRMAKEKMKVYRALARENAHG
ncbi:RNase H [Vibrio phage vB_VpS_PG28]|nr:RNase H [Vibrio phage vB_VpS_PG28]